MGFNVSQMNAAAGAAIGRRRRQGPGAFTGTLIDAAWLSANGPAPYELSIDNEEYRLGTNVTAGRTAFFVTGDNITLDLQTFTITHANDDSQTVANQGFTDNTTGWDLSGAPGATRKTDATYLGKTCYSGTTSLEWIIPDTETQDIETTASFDLVAGEHYAVSFWHTNNTLNPVVTMGSNSGTANINKIGTFAVFQFEAASTESVPLNIQFTNNTGVQDTVYVDEIQFSVTFAHGICVPNSTASPGVSGTAGTGFTLKGSSGSKIVEGVAGIGNSQLNFRGPDLTVTGPILFQSHADSVASRYGNQIYQGFSDGLTISGSPTFDNQIRKIRHRELFDGYNIFCGASGGNVDIDGAICLDGNQGFIYAQNNSGAAGDNVSISVKNCSGTFRAKYTNGFFIQVGIVGSANNQDHYIQNNTMDVTGVTGAGGRFIHLDTVEGGGSGSTTCSGNTCITTEQANNQEYGGFVTGGTYANEPEDKSQDLTISNESYTINGSAGGAAFRPKATPGEVLIFAVDDITLAADSSDFSERMTCFMPYGMTAADSGPFDGWSFTTNDGWIDADRNNVGQLQFTNTHFEYIDDGGTASPWLRKRFGDLSCKFLNPTFEDAGSLAHIKQAPDDEDTTASTFDAVFAYDVVFTFEDSGGNPQSGLLVTIKDASTATVYSGTSDDSGQISTELTFYEIDSDESSDVLTDSNPFSIETDYNGGTTTSVTLTESTRTSTFNLDA